MEKKLVELFNQLNKEDKHAVLRYVEFLSDSSVENSASTDEQEPIKITADENESVIGALKRLSASYPMLDKSKMLDETSQLMAQHTLQGRPKEEIIREFELLFETHYQKRKNALGET